MFAFCLGAGASAVVMAVFFYLVEEELVAKSLGVWAILNAIGMIISYQA